MKKRILVLLTVVAMMVGMLALSVAPAAFAHDGVICTGNWFAQSAVSHPADEDGDGWFCAKFGKHGVTVKDDHAFGGH